ncbi:NifU family protein [Tuwongella immobilis]|uniref:NIF system FeS cluster assembly NifU C-terminal domain-containing protein n=1 Tax=Tuwongella immobilis TaxID=692036 RepID=A0A6C2YTW4_9BACT|nr:NifU family protein [Tuwongella immobilis]VIP04831.1 nitrogen-fixing domain-containing protein : Nitrogen-fixing NifU-like OS=Trichodesmium erythraeum (strain IMS101) GN=Tery_3402 PE=4 SV=1: NifU [Tuwongella immobilis]VTS07022.1 nitrogen-fixing domain-containing protein : Nitrogen-fixing NifU-like OS=Trichodesmium erythraeum (strain IMS101) GN=Tery_3402 PE=4 SV=1: NifU [Tuwongella immobilis]
MSESLKEQVARILTEEVAPAFELDGSRIEVVDVSDGVAQLRFDGVCSSCPATLMTIIMGLEQELQKRIPQIAYIEAVI